MTGFFRFKSGLGGNAFPLFSRKIPYLGYIIIFRIGLSLYFII